MILCVHADTGAVNSTGVKGVNPLAFGTIITAGIIVTGATTDSQRVKNYYTINKDNIFLRHLIQCRLVTW